MTLNINSLVFKRLANLCPDEPVEGRDFLSGVHIQRLKNMNVVATSTNAHVMAVELIGCDPTPGTEQAIVRAQSDILNDCADDRMMTITSAGVMMTGKDGFMKIYLDSLIACEIDYQKIWNERIGNGHIEFKGTISFCYDFIQKLALASPDNTIVFPEKYDSKKAIVVNSVANTNWFGMFLPSVNSEKRQPEFAKLPGWIK